MKTARRSEVNATILKFLLKYGKEYTLAPLPTDIPKSKRGYCYERCMALAIKNKKYTYVEGIGIDKSPEYEGSNEYLMHAWLTDGVHAYDPTWARRNGKELYYAPVSKYFGIEIPTKYIDSFLDESQPFGALSFLLDKKYARDTYMEFMGDMGWDQYSAYENITDGARRS